MATYLSRMPNGSQGRSKEEVLAEMIEAADGNTDHLAMLQSVAEKMGLEWPQGPESTPEPEDRARELHRQWRAILDIDYYDLDEEQSAYDALIEHLEANDLNYSRWDPRPERGNMITTEQATYQPKVGDIYVETWGYEQTNISYWEIVGVSTTGKTVQVLRIEQQFTGERKGIDDIVVPLPGEYSKTEQDWHVGEDGYVAVTRRVPTPTRKTLKFYQGRPYFKATSFSSAFLWSGHPNRQTNPAFGH